MMMVAVAVVGHQSFSCHTNHHHHHGFYDEKKINLSSFVHLVIITYHTQTVE